MRDAEAEAAAPPTDVETMCRRAAFQECADTEGCVAIYFRP